MIAFRFRENCAGQRSKRERGRLVRPVFGIGFQGRSIVRVPLKPHLGVSCIWRLLNFALWPGRKPFGGAENSPIGFICELKKQVRLCPVLFGEGQSAISDRAGVAHGHLKSRHNRTRLKVQEKRFGSGPLAGATEAAKGSRGSDPRLLGLTIGGLLDAHLGCDPVHQGSSMP